MLTIPFENQYVKLGDRFFVKTGPSAVSNPALIAFNDVFAQTLGISVDNEASREVVDIFSGNRIPEGAEPIAMAYAGHQFGHFVPQLGDGRALLLGEVRGQDGVNYGLHLKGSGHTQFSRNGDGLAALGPVLREYLVSEAMHQLNVPTTRALAALTTGDQVLRETPLPGGIITRVAKSFVRVGTFEYFYAQNDVDAIRNLADHVIAMNYPDVAQSGNPYLALLQGVVERQAALIAKWMQLGFIHGVMNTDNMSIAGETIDYGPCAFMDTFNFNQVFSSIDRNGRYAYVNQPSIALWNLTRLAECLLSLIDSDTQKAVEYAQAVLSSFVEIYQRHWLSGMRAKCGLGEENGLEQDDVTLITELLDIMEKNTVDFTLFFSGFSRFAGQDSENDQTCHQLFDNPVQFEEWLARWRERIAREHGNQEERQAMMRAVNPVYIPRNHQIEAVIRAAEDHGDFTPFHELHAVLQQPFENQPGKERFQSPPESDEVVKFTFCGT